MDPKLSQCALCGLPSIAQHCVACTAVPCHDMQVTIFPCCALCALPSTWIPPLCALCGLPSCAMLCHVGFHICLLWPVCHAQHLAAQLCALCGLPSTCPALCAMPSTRPAGSGRVSAATSTWLLTIPTAINLHYMRYACANIKLSRLQPGNNQEASNAMHSTAFAQQLFSTFQSHGHGP